MGSLSSRVLRHQGRARAQPEPGSGAGGSARRVESGDVAGHGFYYCPGSHKRKRSSGALCYCHPDSETDEEEEEGDEQQRLLNTPRRYVGWGGQPHLLGGSCGPARWRARRPVCLGAAALSQAVRSRRVLDGVNVESQPDAGRVGCALGDAWCSGLKTTDAARVMF